LETPALKIFKEADPKEDKLLNRIAHRDIVELDAKGKPTKKIIVKEDEYITKETAKKIAKIYAPLKALVPVKPFFS
jgi:hypothetical protein